MKSYADLDALDINLADGVLRVALDRPERLNAFNGAMRYSIRALIDRAATDDDVRVVVLTGNGRGFCSGADLTTDDRRPWPTGPAEPLFQWCVDLLNLPKPTIAAVNGVAAGGGLGLALLCDFRLAAEDARLIPIWLKRAIHPDNLITWTLPRLVGYSRALNWLYRAEDIPLDEARATGVLLDVVPGEALMEKTLDLAHELAAGPTAHFALTKTAVLRGLSEPPGFAATQESWGQDRARETEDYKEGIKAFSEKRPPKFAGR